MSDFNQLYDRYVNNSMKKEDYQLECENIVEAIFDELPELNVIFAEGYTPYFNDGDLCTHSHCVAVGNASDFYEPDLAQAIRETTDGKYVLVGHDDCEDEETEIPEGAIIIPAPYCQYGTPNGPKATPLEEKALELMNQAPLEEAYDTDFRMCWERTPEGIKRRHVEYNPEY